MSTMTENKPRETQQELFEEFSAAKRPERFPAIARSQKPLLFNTTVEQMLTIGIILILVLCGVFFLGVMRGKAIKNDLLASPVPAPAASAPAVPAAAAKMPRALPAVQPEPPKKTAAQTPAPAAPAAVAAVPSASKPYTIQLVTHRKKEFAEKEMNAVRQAGFYSFILQSGEYYLVCAGQYSGKDEAKKDLGRFSGRYKDCFVRKR